MSSPQPLISVVVTVFNKAKYLPATIRSLTEQEGDLAVEYIFVDDVSTDDSVSVVERCTAGIPFVTIIKNSDNQGPSIRINQGVRLARGKYVLCFDSDDILAANALKIMSDALEANDADVVYGNWSKTEEVGEALLGKRILADACIDVSDKPLEMVLTGRFLRMQFMAKRETYLVAGGADERVFIQDESLPLRMAAHAKRWLKLHDTVMYVPHIEGALSRNVSQLNHDRFLAHYYLIKDYPLLPENERRLAFKRAVSAGWKQIRHERGVLAFMHWIFRAYVKSRGTNVAVNLSVLEHIFSHMQALKSVRRTGV
jgi:glycosyltransferase involved in cell wall biosynthesis